MAGVTAAGAAPRDIQYLIIGGGLAGLAAANYLVQKGHRDFLLLEARKRLGGRVMTLEIGKRRIQWRLRSQGYLLLDLCIECGFYRGCSGGIRGQLCAWNFGQSSV